MNVVKWLEGKKTYATAAAILVCGVLRWRGIEIPEFVWAALAALGLGFLRVGVQKSKLPIVLMLLLPMLAIGCNGVPTERQTYAASAETLTATMHVIADLYDAGKIEQDDHARAVKYAILANAALHEWHERLINNKSVAGAIRSFNEKLKTLQQVAAKGGGE